jgi:hypothetical protein
MSAWELPTSLSVGGEFWNIRTDFRAILDILKCFSDPEYQDVQWEICLRILYEDFEKMPPELYDKAMEQAIDFIDMGIKDDGKRRPHTMDWEQDAVVIIPSVNRVVGREIRSLEYMHWWTFLGAYMEIGESLFSQIIHVRQKLAKHQKLEKWEKDFYKENKNLVDLEKRYTEEEQKEIDELLSIF